MGRIKESLKSTITQRLCMTEGERAVWKGQGLVMPLDLYMPPFDPDRTKLEEYNLIQIASERIEQDIDAKRAELADREPDWKAIMHNAIVTAKSYALHAPIYAGLMILSIAGAMGGGVRVDYEALDLNDKLRKPYKSKNEK